MPMKHRAIRSSWLFEPNVWCMSDVAYDTDTCDTFGESILVCAAPTTWCTDLSVCYISRLICNQYAMWHLHRSSTCNGRIDLSLRCICFHGGLDLPMASASIKLQALQAKASSPLFFGFSFSFSSFSFFLSPSRSPRGKYLNASFIVWVYDNP